LATSIFSYFLKVYFLKLAKLEVASADKMMVKAKGPVWHRTQQKQGIIPEGLPALDTEASWSYSKADGWVYGQGSFCITTHQPPGLGMFKWLPNDA
jgi:hypothetical protein